MIIHVKWHIPHDHPCGIIHPTWLSMRKSHKYMNVHVILHILQDSVFRCLHLFFTTNMQVHIICVFNMYNSSAHLRTNILLRFYNMCRHIISKSKPVKHYCTIQLQSVRVVACVQQNMIINLCTLKHTGVFGCLGSSTTKYDFTFINL